jgi:hypothetical protein
MKEGLAGLCNVMILDEDDWWWQALVTIVKDQAGYYPVSAAQWISLEIADHETEGAGLTACRV